MFSEVNNSKAMWWTDLGTKCSNISMIHVCLLSLITVSKQASNSNTTSFIGYRTTKVIYVHVTPPMRLLIVL